MKSLVFIKYFTDKHFKSCRALLFQSSGSSCCWRNCGFQKAGHYHIFWTCPKLNTLLLFAELVALLRTNNNIFLFCFVQLWIAKFSICKFKKYDLLWFLMSLMDRKANTKKWLKPEVLALEDWYILLRARRKSVLIFIYYFINSKSNVTSFIFPPKLFICLFSGFFCCCCPFFDHRMMQYHDIVSN